jgi:polyphenol oxidase
MDNSIITYPVFENFQNVLAFTTCRHTINGENTPRFTGKPEHKTEENRYKLAEILGINAKQLVFPGQTHTNRVVNLSGIPKHAISDTDALVTNKPDICLCVQTADCVPILLFDPVKNVVAAIHAGWRGTVAHIVGTAINKIIASFQTNPYDLRAVLGPSISPESYEVGNEVADVVIKKIPNAERTLVKGSNDKYHLNLWEANRQLLLSCGLNSEKIQIFGRCTFQEKNKFFSARRDGIKTGRLVSGIMLKHSP